VLIIYIFIRINCSFKNKKLKKNKGKRYTQRVKEHNVSNAYYCTILFVFVVFSLFQLNSGYITKVCAASAAAMQPTATIAAATC